MEASECARGMYTFRGNLLRDIAFLRQFWQQLIGAEEVKNMADNQYADMSPSQDGTPIGALCQRATTHEVE